MVLTRPNRPPTDFRLWHRTGTVQVVGEQFYEKNIRSVFGDRNFTTPQELTTVAALIPEPHNRHDRNAVAVHVAGKQVGHLAADLAPSYQPLLIDMLRRGVQPTVACRVIGRQWYEEPADSRFGRRATAHFFGSVILSLSAPHLCEPSNDAPGVPHRLLPSGSATQVTGEERHLDVLAPLVENRAETWVWATLEKAAGGTPKAPKDIVQCQVDGRLVGALSPTGSAHFLPVIDHLRSHGMATAAQLLLKGNALKVEAVVYAAKAHELGNEWLQGVAEMAGLSAGVAPHSEPQGPAAPRTFNPAPGWPAPPTGWIPPAGWRPPPDWPPAPPGWGFWV